ncbi:hypothetical protein COV12_00530 [Candidatus Woesearchaeota archaeon CG10_big_fil_rev_8_21_14_0_10_32_24]|nr:MAG: hypothetical protein COV12_00530 [Candidatus Woesearchaeota archaeon CG10_big_fil_rev_8_21_14_0_10_32_24]
MDLDFMIRKKISDVSNRADTLVQILHETLQLNKPQLSWQEKFDGTLNVGSSQLCCYLSEGKDIIKYVIEQDKIIKESSIKGIRKLSYNGLTGFSLNHISYLIAGYSTGFMVVNLDNTDEIRTFNVGRNEGSSFKSFAFLNDTIIAGHSNKGLFKVPLNDFREDGNIINHSKYKLLNPKKDERILTTNLINDLNDKVYNKVYVTQANEIYQVHENNGDMFLELTQSLELNQSITALGTLDQKLVVGTKTGEIIVDGRLFYQDEKKIINQVQQGEYGSEEGIFFSYLESTNSSRIYFTNGQKCERVINLPIHEFKVHNDTLFAICGKKLMVNNNDGRKEIDILRTGKSIYAFGGN